VPIHLNVSECAVFIWTPGYIKGIKYRSKGRETVSTRPPELPGHGYIDRPDIPQPDLEKGIGIVSLQTGINAAQRCFYPCPGRTDACTTHCYRSYTGYKNGSLRGNRKIIGLLGGPIYINQQLIPCSYYIIFGSGNVHAGTKVQLLVVKKCISKDLFLFGCKVIIRV